MNTAYVSHAAMWDDQLAGQRLRMATLLYDRIYFGSELPGRVVDSVLGLGDSSESLRSDDRYVLEDCWIGANRADAPYSIYGPDGRWPWKHAPVELREATRAAIPKASAGLVTPAIEGMDYDWYKLGGFVMSDILHWRAHFPDSTLLGDRLGERIVSRIRASGDDEALLFRHVDAKCVDLTELSWAELVELRQSPFLDSFRGKFMELAVSNDLNMLSELYLSALEGIADAVRPTPLASSLEAALGSIPVAVVNPIGVASGARQVLRQMRLKSEYGWAFFVRDVHAIADHSDSPSNKRLNHDSAPGDVDSAGE